MAEHKVTFYGIDLQDERQVHVPTGTLISEAARLAGVEIAQPCGGQGRCGRCIVQIREGYPRRRSTLHLNLEDILAGFALACHTVVEGELSVDVPKQEKIGLRLTSDRTAREVSIPAGYDAEESQTIRRVRLSLTPPSLDDHTDDWSRFKTCLRQAEGFPDVQISLSALRNLGHTLRQADWQVTAVLDLPTLGGIPRLVHLEPGLTPEGQPLWGAAIDIGTTTVSVWLVDLVSGEVRAQVSEYNQQISRGEDVISRIIYASKNNGSEVLRNLVLETINGLLQQACKRVLAHPEDILKAVITGNSTMMHLLLGVSGESIRLSPFITAFNEAPLLRADEVGINLHPEASVDCLPGVASYVGADITAGVLASGMDDSPQVSLFMDIGTNGEIVLGSQDWLVTCACSAGPAFEGAGVKDGMRATLGAIEEVWINSKTFEPSARVIGGGRPRGLCGSGLISLLAELFLTGAIDKSGNFDLSLDSPRLRQGENGPEYVVVWAVESEHQRDITLTHVDIDNLLRAKAAIYAGFSLLAERVGFPLERIEEVLIGGSFGKYINVEKAIQIGLLPDMNWKAFKFLGNTSILGAYMALLDYQARAKIADIASRMTYIELSADNAFYEAFTSALFLPHTDLSRFPNVAQVMGQTV